MNSMEKDPETGREIADRVDAEVEAQELADDAGKKAQRLIDMIRSEDDSQSGLGLEGFEEELKKQDSEEGFGNIGNAVMNNVLSDLEVIRKFYNNFFEYLNGNENTDIDGDGLVDYFSQESRIKALVNFVNDEGIKGFLDQLDWGRLLIEISDYLKTKFPERLIKTEQVGDIAITVPYFN